jgi:hypothetical protein
MPTGSPRSSGRSRRGERLMALDECHDCGARPGEMHADGCDVERCPLCGGQLISCHCVLELNGLDPATLEKGHPEIYFGGSTPAMDQRYEEEVAKYGGYLPWTGEWPGDVECREFGWYCKRDGHRGWVRCGADDPDATEDVNRLYRDARWDKVRRRWVLRDAG